MYDSENHLVIQTKPIELYDERTNTVIAIDSQVLILEHSLKTISLWESRWKKSFFDDKKAKTNEELNDYIRCMNLNPKVDPNTFLYLPNYVVQKVNAYINDQMTATWFGESKDSKARNRRTITSELIYYFMFSYQIPMECERWHINKLLTLIKVFNEENKASSSNGKKAPVDIAQRKALLAQRRAKQRSK
jgi:hypothetical protein